MTTNLAQVEPTRQAEACNSRLECLHDRKGIYGIGMVGGKEERHIILRPDKVREFGQITRYGHVAFQQIVPSGPLRRTAEFYLAQTLREKMLERAGLPRHEVNSENHWWSHDKKEQDANRRKYFAYRKSSIVITNALMRKALAEVPADLLHLIRKYPIRYRQSLYTAVVHDGEYALQLANTFPVLALLIYGVEFVEGEHKEKQKQAAAMVCRGVELKHIAAVFDLPLMFRKFGPYSAIDAARLTGTLAALPELVHSYMPTSEKAKKRWLKAIRRASMTGPPFIRWTARHALDLGKTIDDVVFTLEDINDWVVASYASTIPDYVWIAIIQHGPPREQKYNARFITRPFHEDMSLNTVRQLSEEWHHAVAEAGPEGENYAFPPPWYPKGKVGNLEIVPIQTLADLYLEGKTMHHCATTYADQIKAGSSYMYGIKKGEERIATLELHISSDNDVEFGQLRGPCNARVQSDVTRAARRWFSQCKREHGNCMPKLRVISPPINDGWDEDVPF